MSFMTQSVVIERPVEEVFKAAVDFSNSPQIMEAVVAVELLSEGPVREGYKFKETREIRGRKVSAVIEVTAIEKTGPIRSKVFRAVLTFGIITSLNRHRKGRK